MAGTGNKEPLGCHGSGPAELRCGLRSPGEAQHSLRVPNTAWLGDTEMSPWHCDGVCSSPALSSASLSPRLLCSSTTSHLHLRGFFFPAGAVLRFELGKGGLGPEVGVSRRWDLPTPVTPQIPALMARAWRLQQEPRAAAGSVCSESRDGFAGQEPAGRSAGHQKSPRPGSRGWMEPRVRPHERILRGAAPLPALPVRGDQGWEEGGSFFTLGAGETSPSMRFHLTSPCHICQLLLITEFAITLCTDVKGRENRKRRLRDSTIINDVWQAEVPYNAL